MISSVVMTPLIAAAVNVYHFALLPIINIESTQVN